LATALSYDALIEPAGHYLASGYLIFAVNQSTTHAGKETELAPLRQPSAFVTTHWSVVLAAAVTNSPGADSALEDLCQTYWPPLYAYVRRRGYSTTDAQDLTQEFFARLLRRNAVADVSPQKGRFRSFLLASMNHFLADEWDKSRAAKRGGGNLILTGLEEADRVACCVENSNPETVFEQRWAIALLEGVYRQLEKEYEARGKAGLFDILRGTLAAASGSISGAEMARQLQMNEGAVKVAVHRLRKRYREVLRAKIAETVSTAAEVDEELRYLFQTLDV
jgi:RNA polymerase sigma-70 factor (ECF subfamily)